MWFSVVCSFIENDTRHHSGQNVVEKNFFSFPVSKVIHSIPREIRAEQKTGTKFNKMAVVSMFI